VFHLAAGVGIPAADVPDRSECARRTWRNFDRAVLPRDPDEAKTDNDRVRREDKVRKLWKERTLIIHMHALIFRAA
jgi:hypothetical protein